MSDDANARREAAEEHAALGCERTRLAAFNLAKAMKAAAAGDWDEWLRRMAAVECLSVGAHHEFARAAEASRPADGERRGRDP